MDLLSIAIILALLATVLALALGLMAMGNQSLDKEVSTPLMWVRVGLQGFAVLLLLIAIWLH